LEIFLIVAVVVLETVYFGHIASPFTDDIFTEISGLFLPHEPAISPHVVEVYIFAGIGDVAADGVGEEETVVHAYVLHCDVAHGHSGFRFTDSLAEGVEHATGTVAVGFLHLLRTDVDAPPDGPVHCEVLEVEVFDYAGALVAGVGLHVDALDGPDHVPVAGRDVADAVAAGRGRQATDGHSDAELDSHVLDQHFFSAAKGVVERLGDDHIIEVLDSQIVDMEAGAGGVYPIGIEGEHEGQPLQREKLDKADLGCGVDFDVEVEDLAVVAFVVF
jgi:hypothetical protein